MKKLKSMLLFGAAAVFALTSCEDEVKPTVETPTSQVIKSGVITADETWTADKVYRLDGRVTVAGGATLTIEPGTVIKANPGAGSFASALLISREGKIMANGRADAPIIFTTVADDIKSGEFNSPNLSPENNGLWGGVIILGKAPIAASSASVQIEGIPTSDQNGLYGGTEPTHSSGEFSYVSIRHGGANIGAGNEINGLTLGGVGSGTKISNIEIVANQDDGIEFFGGEVAVSNVLIWNCADDGLDTDQDWIGTCDNFVIVTPRGGSAFELDGPEGGKSATGTHVFTNGTVYAGSDIHSLIDWDGGTNAAVQNVYFFGLDANYGYIADDPATTEEDEELKPFASFGGDMSGTTSGLEILLPAGRTLADLFEPGATIPSAVTAVSSGGKTVGADVSAFAWTWASKSGTLSQIGVQ